jgi:glycosyltransferase involved in cell wall biosynthesis
VALTAGFIEPSGLRDRRISVCLDAFRKLLSQHPECRYIVAGLSKSARRDWQEIVKSRGLEDSVLMFEDSSGAVLRELNQISDVRLQFRHPCVSFTSGSVIKSLAQGKPVITSDGPRFEDLPTSCVWRVSPEEPYEAELLFRYLDRLFKEPELRSEMGRNAIRYCEQRGWPQIAQRIHDLLVNSTSL